MPKKIEKRTPATQTINSRAKDILAHETYPESSREDAETFEQALQLFADSSDLPDNPYKTTAESAATLLNALHAITRKRPHIKISATNQNALTLAPDVIESMKQRMQAFIDDPKTTRADKNRGIKSLDNLDAIGALLDSLRQEIGRANTPPTLDL